MRIVRAVGERARRAEPLDVDLRAAGAIGAVDDARCRSAASSASHSIDVPLDTMCTMRPVVSTTTICEMIAAQPARRDDVVAGVRPARLGPLLVVAARRERRDPLAVARHAHETRRAGGDLLGDDLAVGARVGARQPLRRT